MSEVQLAEINTENKYPQNSPTTGMARMRPQLDRQGGSVSLVVDANGNSLLMPEAVIDSKKSKKNAYMFVCQPNHTLKGGEQDGNTHWLTIFEYVESSQYRISEDLRAGFIDIQEQAGPLRGELAAVTIQLNDEINKKIYGSIQDKTSKKLSKREIKNEISKRGPANYIAKRFLESGWPNSFMLVVERSDKASKVTFNGKFLKRLHVHIHTFCPPGQEDELRRLSKRLGKPDSSGVKIKTSYKRSRPYTVYDQIEEDEYGPIPKVPGHNNEYWMNRYRIGNKIYTRLPVDIGWASYMSKDLHKPVVKGQGKRTSNFATRGLINNKKIKQKFRDDAKQRKQASGNDKIIIQSAPTEKQVEKPIVLEKTDRAKRGPDCPANAILKIPGRLSNTNQTRLSEALAELQELEEWLQQRSRNQPDYDRQKRIKNNCCLANGYLDSS